MNARRLLLLAGFVALAVAALPHIRPDVTVGPNDIGGVVTGPRGPEAGVWVIAETNDLPTKFVRIVVTDDQGRYLIPDLPKANYNVWVRGYGLVDSPKSTSTPGKHAQPDRRAGAERARGRRSTIPPATGSRCSSVPDKSEFPGTGPTGNGISPNVKSQADFIRTIKSGDVHGVSPARQQGHARDSRRRSVTSRRRCARGSAASSPARPARR